MDHIQEIKEYNSRTAKPEAKAAALLVIDMQRFFEPIARPIVGRVRALIDTSRSVGVPVIFTRHGHHNLSIDGGTLATWWGNDLALYGSPEWRIMEGIEPAPHETIVDKIRYSAFFGTNLEQILKALNVRDIIISGVMTNCCCETTARDGFMRDFRVFVAADATAAANDDLHVASLKGMAFSCAYIMETGDLCGALGRD